MRCFIFGPPGSGKSTCAFRLSHELGLPVFHMDHFFFKAPNIHISTEEAMKELKNRLPHDDWIIEGNHGDALEYLAERADCVYILNVHPLTCIYRIIKRHFQNDPFLKKAVSEGWQETLSWQFIWFTLHLFPKNFPRQIEQIKRLCKGRVYIGNEVISAFAKE
jgi:adenylate kinase family enzyme